MAACGPETASWLASGGFGDSPYPMSLTMVILIALWVGFVFTALGSAVSGVDNCAQGSMCWGVDPETLEGECIAFCDPRADDACGPTQH